MSAFNDAQFEMISAYLDGELSVEECAVVEELLESSEEHRKLLEEMKSLQNDFASLPVVRPQPSMTSQIMAAVEQAPAPTAPTHEAPSPASQASAKTDSSAKRPAAKKRSWLQNATQIVVAAVVLLIAVYGVYRATRTGEKPEDPKLAGSDPPKTPDVDPIVAPKDPLHPPRDPKNSIPDVPGIPPSLGSGFVFNDVKAELLFVIEYAVDPKVIEDGVFKRVLQMHDVEVNDAIVPDAAAQKTIESSRAFGGENEPGDANIGAGEIEFSIVVADIDKLFRISESLRTHAGVRGMKTDLSMSKSDMEMMREINRNRDDQYANAKPGDGGRAYFVALQNDLKTILLGSTMAIAKLEGAPGASIKNLNPNLGGGGQNTMPVVFILRTAAPKK